MNIVLVQPLGSLAYLLKPYNYIPTIKNSRICSVIAANTAVLYNKNLRRPLVMIKCVLIQITAIHAKHKNRKMLHKNRKKSG